MRQRHRGGPSRAVSMGLGCSLLIGLGGTLVVMALALLYGLWTQDLPSPQALPAMLEPPDGMLTQPTRFYDRSGRTVIATLEHPAAGEARYLPLTEEADPHLPAALRLATLAVSDPGFLQHAGYTWRGLRSGAEEPIAQRLVSDLLLWNEPPGFRREVRERLLAAQVTEMFGREKVLEWYLNNVGYGHQAYGADAAAHVYFGKTAAELSLAEAATLAAVSDAPGLNPLDTPEAAVDRGQEVLDEMVSLGLITEQEAGQARLDRLRFQRPAEPAHDPMAAFTQLVRRELEAEFGRERLARGGLRVITTLDEELQRQADCTLGAVLSTPEDRAEDSPLEEKDPCEAARLLPTSDPVGARDGLSLSAAALDPTTGQVLAFAHRPGPAPDPRAAHPPGTLLTPFVHLVAFTRGLSPATLVWDVPASLPEPLRDWEALDPDYDGPMRLRTALANDHLVPTFEVLEQMGAGNVWRTVQQLGLFSLEIPSGVEALQRPWSGGGVTLLEAVHAYGVFSNRGILAGQSRSGGSEGGASLRPTTVLRVEDVSGRVWLDAAAPETRPVISAQLAYLVTDVLRDERARWPSLGHPNPLEIGRPAGAKIGQVADGLHLWTVGFTPRLTLGVWAGRESDEPDGRLPLTLATGLWHALTQYATRDHPIEDWALPPGVTRLEVCDPSGLLPTAECPNRVEEVFLAGNEPTQTDSLYREFQINRETGRLATVFTPPELIEERVYLIVPPEAEEWAVGANLPVPPNTYDLLHAPLPGQGTAAITSPEIFAYTGGMVTIEGRAGGENFAFYRLQYGRGLNPQTWIQIGGDARAPVTNGELGVWNTEGLSGLYALRLQVVRTDQRVDTYTTQVTLDNEPPEVQVLRPLEGETVLEPPDGVLTFQMRVEDNLGVERVDVSVDGRLEASMTGPPYAVPWRVRAGRHTLEVVATDLAGNTDRTSISFTLEGN